MGLFSVKRVENLSTIQGLSNNTASRWWADRGLLHLMPAIAVGFAGIINFGYDGSLMNGLLAMPLFVESIGNPDGNKLGIITAAYSLGVIIGSTMTSFTSDRLGRKKTIAIGAVVIIVGAIFQTFSTGGDQFLGSRIIIGVGAAFQSITAPAFVSEVSHPRFRAQAVALVNTCYYIGAIIAAWTCFGTLSINGNWCWRLPCLVQIVPCTLQLAVLWFIPESPRWLISTGQHDAALSMLCTYHANGSRDDEMVTFEFHEMQEAIANEKAATAGSSYLAFLRSPGNRKRLLIIILVGLFSQWVGNGIISYYLARILLSVGITSNTQQAGLNGGLQIWNWLWSIAGSLSCEKLGRRFLWLTSAVLMLVFYVAITVCSAMYAKFETAAAGYATIAFLFLYFAAYDIAVTGLSIAYPTEILPFSLRTKGLSILFISMNCALFFNQYVNPIALEKLAWRYYIVYIVVIAISIVCIYFLYPETKGLSLEEICVLFDGQRVPLQPGMELRPTNDDKKEGDTTEDLVEVLHA